LGIQIVVLLYSKQYPLIMKKLLIILILIPTLLNMYAQEEEIKESNGSYTVYDIQKNSLHLGTVSLFFISGFYERTIPTGNKSAIIAGGGILQGFTWSDDTNLLGKMGFIVGGTKHFFECGTLINIVRTTDSDLGRILPLVGYRYQSKGGLLLRVDITANIVTETADVTGEEHIAVMPGPGISIGYSF